MKDFVKLSALRKRSINQNFFRNIQVNIFQLNMFAAKQMREMIGAGVHTLSVDTRCGTSDLKRTQAKFNELVTHTPDITVLTITENRNGTSFMENSPFIAQFNDLRTLKLRSLCNPVLAVISQAVVLTWLTKARLVTQLTFSSTLKPAKNSQLGGFLNQVSYLQSLSICLRFRTSENGYVKSLMNTTVRIHSLNLVKEHDAEDLDILIDMWLATQSPYLQHLTYQQHNTTPNLTAIQEKALKPLFTTAGNFIQPFHELGLPHLHCVHSSVYFIAVSINEKEHRGTHLLSTHISYPVTQLKENKKCILNRSWLWK